MDLETPFGYHITKPEKPEKNAVKYHELFTRNTHFVIPFYGPADASENNVALREHGEKCDAVRTFFQQHTNCQIHLVNSPPEGDSDHVTNYMANELAGKGVNDLVMIYHHGMAGYNGKDYTWQSTRYPQNQVNGYKLVEEIHKAKRRGGTDDTNIEFVARGQRLQDADGEIIRDAGDFTYSMISRMKGLLQEVKSRKYKGKAPRSIPEVMAKDKQLDSHLLTLKPKKPKPGCENTIIKRIKMYPQKMKESGKIEFVAMQIQPLADEAPDEQPDGVEVNKGNELGEEEGIVPDLLFVPE